MLSDAHSRTVTRLLVQEQALICCQEGHHHSCKICTAHRSAWHPSSATFGRSVTAKALWCYYTLVCSSVVHKSSAISAMPKSIVKLQAARMHSKLTLKRNLSKHSYLRFHSFRMLVNHGKGQHCQKLCSRNHRTLPGVSGHKNCLNVCQSSHFMLASFRPVAEASDTLGDAASPLSSSIAAATAAPELGFSSLTCIGTASCTNPEGC